MHFSVAINFRYVCSVTWHGKAFLHQGPQNLMNQKRFVDWHKQYYNKCMSLSCSELAAAYS